MRSIVEEMSIAPGQGDGQGRRAARILQLLAPLMLLMLLAPHQSWLLLAAMCLAASARQSRPALSSAANPPAPIMVF
jgi:hypothetical protein